MFADDGAWYSGAAIVVPVVFGIIWVCMKVAEADLGERALVSIIGSGVCGLLWPVLLCVALLLLPLTIIAMTLEYFFRKAKRSL